MASNLLRRSGVAVVKVAELLGWKPDVIVQVGVGGYHKEVDVMKEVWSEARFVGFEPNPDIAEGLIDTYPGQLYASAIADKPSRKKLYFRPKHKDGSSLFPFPVDEEKGQREVDVVVKTLDKMFPFSKNYYGGHILLWLDCEGSELRALQGGEKFVEKVEMINIEMTGNPPNPEWGDHVETHFWLVDHGFLRQTTHTTRSSRGQYDAIYVKPNLFRSELCCCPYTIRESK